MQKQQIPLKNSLLLLLAAIIWGIAFVAQSVGMKYVGGFTFNAVRSLIGAVVLIPLIFILKKRNSPSDSASTAARCCGAPPNRDAYFPIPVSYDRSLLKSYKFVTKIYDTWFSPIRQGISRELTAFSYLIPGKFRKIRRYLPGKGAGDKYGSRGK